ncbi:MAG: hypothetical protein ABEK01_00995 [Candidatus Nanohaloarchaea archaeon]
MSDFLGIEPSEREEFAALFLIVAAILFLSLSGLMPDQAIAEIVQGFSQQSETSRGFMDSMLSILAVSFAAEIVVFYGLGRAMMPEQNNMGDIVTVVGLMSPMKLLVLPLGFFGGFGLVLTGYIYMTHYLYGSSFHRAAVMVFPAVLTGFSVLIAVMMF